MPHLFDPLTLRSVTLRNRIAVSPMCQYSCIDGMANDWHLVHLGARAVGGAGLVMAEATAVEARGRITPEDLGIWSDAHIEPLARVARFIAAQGSVPAIQLAHAGRKASRARPWAVPTRRWIPEAEGGWTPVGASAVRFDAIAADDGPDPTALSIAEIEGVIAAFADAARRSVEAGFTVIEIHSAHGYLLHSFLSPISNRRDDRYGGDLEGRCRMVRETARAIRSVIPDALPLFLRLSCTDWVEPEPTGGWTLDDSVALARGLREDGVDLIDCSSGGSVGVAPIPTGPGYQVELAERIRREAQIPVGAVGAIDMPELADEIIRAERADLILVGRAHLHNPHWALDAASALGRPKADLAPPQYRWVFTPR